MNEQTSKIEVVNYQTLLENLDDIVYSVDMRTEEFSYVSPAFKRILGYSLEDITELGGRKKFLSQVIQYGAFQEQLKALVEFFKGKKGRPRHTSIWKTKDGSTKVLEDSWVPVYDKEEVLTVHGVLRDVSDGFKLRKEAEEHKRFWQGVFISSPDAIVALDSDNRIAGWNKVAEELFGYSASEALGQNVDTLIAANNEETLREAQDITQRTSMGEQIPNVESVRYRKDGTPVNVRISGSAIMVGNEFLGSVGIYTDITDRRKAENELKKSIEEKDFLMKEINHRVKNNLSMISALINLKNSSLKEGIDLSDLEHQIDAIRIVHEKLYQSEEIIRIDFNHYVEDLLETIFSSFTDKEVKIETAIENVHLPTAAVVPLGLIINELATNAIKHGFTTGDPKFSVKFSSSNTNNEYCLTIANTGNPFPDDIDFDNPETLGLRLILTLTEQLHGTIDLKRTPSPVFTIRFPSTLEGGNPPLR